MFTRIFYSAVGYVRHAFAGKYHRINPDRLPTAVLSYSLIKDLRPEKHFPFKTGLYKNSQGKKVVIKIWQGRYKDIYYFDLIHQIKSLEILHSVYNRIHLELPNRLKHVKIPELYSYVDSGNSVTLIMEFVPGKPLSSISSRRKQLRIYRTVLDYLSFMGSRCSREEISGLTKKPLYHYLLVFPFIWIVAVLQNPGLIPLLIKILPVYFYTAVNYLGIKKLTIVHGDLNFKNILTFGRSIYFLDIEQMSYTYPDFELIASLSALNTPEYFKKSKVQEIIIKAKSSIQKRNQLIFTLINCHVHNLTWNAPAENVIWYTKMLKFGNLLLKSKSLKYDQIF